jgi:enoyl-CoA hydratase
VEVALATLTRARGGTLREALQQELRSGTGLAARPDFTEGIRAQLVDKDRRPRWDPPTLEQVDPAVVAAVLDTDVPPLFPAPEPPRTA